MAWFQSNCSEKCLMEKLFSTNDQNGLKCKKYRQLSNLGGSVEPRLLLVDKKCVRHPDQLDVVRSYHQLLKPVLNAKINNKNKNCNACNFQHLYIFFLLKQRLCKEINFLPDPGVSGVRSMGPGVSIYVTTSRSFVKLYWCDYGWWWYQLNTNWWCQ